MNISKFIEKLRMTNTQRWAGIPLVLFIRVYNRISRLRYYGIGVIYVVRQECKIT
jgi:hypothetical protein